MIARRSAYDVGGRLRVHVREGRFTLVDRKGAFVVVLMSIKKEVPSVVPQDIFEIVSHGYCRMVTIGIARALDGTVCRNDEPWRLFAAVVRSCQVMPQPVDSFVVRPSEIENHSSVDLCYSLQRQRHATFSLETDVLDGFPEVRDIETTLQYVRPVRLLSDTVHFTFNHHYPLRH